MTMCQDLNEYDPFEPIVIYSIGYWGDIETEIKSEPMEDYNWEEWLEIE
jgi:hypothetical protein